MLRSLFSQQKSNSVAIILRTKNRPAFLRRALQSITSQTYKNWTLFVINDGGEKEIVEQILAPYQQQYSIQCKHLKRTSSQGLGFLINYGIKRTKSEFIAVHDDDDTWHPEFLAQCLAQIGTKEAIVTLTDLVTEYFDNGIIKEHNRTLMNPWQRHALSLIRLAEGVTFPSISFLFRRRAWKSVGMFNESLPHKEDWEFSLRFFSRYPIHFLESALANFHYRANDYEPINGNLALDHGPHFAAETEVRNLLLRDDITHGKMGLGYLTSLAGNRGMLFRSINSVANTIDTVLSAQHRDQKQIHHPIGNPASMIHVAYAADERFSLPLSISLCSLAENHKSNSPIHAHIIDGGITKESKEHIYNSIKKYSFLTLSWYSYDWRDIQELHFRERFSKAVLGRILLPTILSTSIEKVLYLDSDTLILEDIEPLFQQDAANYPLWAAQDYTGQFNSPAAGIRNLNQFGIRGDEKYFNSGVLLFNLNKWRDEKITEEILAFIKKNPDTLHLGDQNPINIYLHKKIGELDFSWNFQLPDRNMREGHWIFSTITSNAKPKILHFVSTEKPWLTSDDRPYKNLYKQYAQKTTWDLPATLMN